MRAFLSLVAIAAPLSAAPPPQSVLVAPLPQSVVPESASPTARDNSPAGTWDVLEELNAQRRALGLEPFIWDKDLTIAAGRVSQWRAERLMFGHAPSDFAFLAPGVGADAAGCAAYPASYGFMACAMYEPGLHYAGAAYTLGQDGRRFCHLFIRRAGVVRQRTVIRESSGPSGYQATVRMRSRFR